MKNIVSIAIACVAVYFLAACTKTEIQDNSPSANSTEAQLNAGPSEKAPDYRLICQRLTALAPDSRKVPLSENCEIDYKKMLPSCQNASAVNSCYANMKDWSERLACLDSCVRQ